MERRKRHMPNRWSLAEDLQARLSGCTFMYDGKLVYLQVRSNGKIEMYNPSVTEMLGNIKHDDPLLDVGSPPLGYCNLDTAVGIEVVYTYRQVQRGWKQGMTCENVRCQSIDGQAIGGTFMMTDGRAANVLQTKGFEDGLNGKFPSYRMVREKAQKGLSIALSQSVAIRANKAFVEVFYRTKSVGFIIKDEFVPNTPMSWIIQSELEELGLLQEVKNAA